MKLHKVSTGAVQHPQGTQESLEVIVIYARPLSQLFDQAAPITGPPRLQRTVRRSLELVQEGRAVGWRRLAGLVVDRRNVVHNQADLHAGTRVGLAQALPGVHQRLKQSVGPSE